MTSTLAVVVFVSITKTPVGPTAMWSTSPRSPATHRLWNEMKPASSRAVRYSAVARSPWAPRCQLTTSLGSSVTTFTKATPVVTMTTLAIIEFSGQSNRNSMTIEMTAMAATAGRNPRRRALSRSRRASNIACTEAPAGGGAPACPTAPMSTFPGQFVWANAAQPKKSRPANSPRRAVRRTVGPPHTGHAGESLEPWGLVVEALTR